MNFDTINNLYDIAKSYKVKLHIVTYGDKYHKANGLDMYRDTSYIIGNDEIILGIYEDVELLIASFFHELGHSTITKAEINKLDFDIYQIENLAWKKGRKLAKLYNASFNKNQIDWANKQLQTYL